MHQRYRNACRTLLPATIIIVTIFFFHQAYPDIIQAGDGFGVDGVLYAKMVVHLQDMINNSELSRYHAQRILPSFVIKTILSITGNEFSRENIIYAFMYMNFFLTLLALVLWFAASYRLRLSRLAFWIGFSGIALCFQSAKNIYYYPVLTDTFALAIGCGFLYAAVVRNAYLVFLLAMIGAFTWQISSAAGALMIIAFLFEFQKTPLVNRLFIERRPILYSLISCILLISFVVAASSVALSMMGPDRKRHFLGRILNFDFIRMLTNSPTLLLIALGALSILIAAYLAKPRLAAGPLKIAAHVIVAGLIIAIPAVIVRSISNPDIVVFGVQGFRETLSALLLDRVFSGMVLQPLIAHAVYYGPVFLLLIVRWPDAVRSAIALGPAVVLMLLLFLGLAGFSESRFSILMWPFAVAVTAYVYKSENTSTLFNATFILLVIVFSSVWLRTNDVLSATQDSNAFHQWIGSVLTTRFGPSMDWPAYAGQGIVVLAALGWLAWVTRNGEREASGTSPSSRIG